VRIVGDFDDLPDDLARDSVDRGVSDSGIEVLW